MKRSTIARALLITFVTAGTSAFAQVAPSSAQGIRIGERAPDPTKAPPTHKAPRKVKLPRAVGKVQSVHAGRFVPGAPVSWLVEGRKYHHSRRFVSSYSLCYPAATGQTACTPVASTITGVKLAFHQYSNGAGVIVFKGTDVKASAVNVAAGFMPRLLKARIGLDKYAVLHANDRPAIALTAGVMASSAYGGESCYYDDNGNHVCSSGDNGGYDGDNGGDGDGNTYDGGSEADGFGGDYDSPLGDYPVGIPRIMPYPMPAGCVATGSGDVVCSVTGQRDPFAEEQLPRTRVDWPSIDWDALCRSMGMCSDDAIPAKPAQLPVPPVPVPAESYHDDPQYIEDCDQCQLAYERDMDECKAYRLNGKYGACSERAAINNEWCLAAARDAARARAAKP